MARSFRIFISSPGDVAEERRRAVLVIRRLKREFARFFDLSAVLWEYEPMLASGHFQDIIERPSTTDIMVLIVWSRLGTPLPEDRYRGLDGRVPVTGTEWEYEEALAARHERGLPDILVYRKQAEAVALFSRKEQIRAAEMQWEALQAFWERHFEAGGIFKTAFNTFIDLGGFEAMLEEHLRELLRRRLPERPQGGRADGAITWHNGSPFRGLSTFEPEHSAIFFGRERAEREVTEALVQAAEAGCAFLLVLGSSGTGKSSLVRAGVLPNLTAPGVVAGVEAWRWCLFRPGLAGGDILDGLARSLVEQEPALAGLEGTGVSRAALVEQFRAAPAQAMLPISVGLTQATGRAAAARLVLVVDQLEEIFTLPEVTAEQRRAFALALEGMARSGLVWVVATLRSDFYHRLAEVPELSDLAAGRRQYHLMPPRPAELEQLIRRPAEAAGLAFEADAEGGPGLDAALAEAAGRDAGSLPLVSFALNELYRRDIEEGKGDVLTFANYRALGNLEGVVARRAEEVAAQVCQSLPMVMEEAFSSVLRAMVAVGEDGSATARVVSRAEAASTIERASVLDALVAARLVVTAGDAAGVTVRLAHEALLGHWPRLQELAQVNREFLRVRGRLMADRARWEAEGRSDDLLLPSGKRLVEAEDLLASRRDELDAGTVSYVERSIRRDRHEREQRLRQTRVAAAVMGLLAIAAAGFGLWGYDRSVEVEHQRVLAEDRQKEAEENAAESRRQEAAARQALAKAEAAEAEIRTVFDQVVSLITTSDPTKIRSELALLISKDREVLLKVVGSFIEKSTMVDQDFKDMWKFASPNISNEKIVAFFDVIANDEQTMAYMQGHINEQVKKNASDGSFVSNFMGDFKRRENKITILNRILDKLLIQDNTRKSYRSNMLALSDDKLDAFYEKVLGIIKKQEFIESIDNIDSIRFLRTLREAHALAAKGHVREGITLARHDISRYHDRVSSTNATSYGMDFGNYIDFVYKYDGNVSIKSEFLTLGFSDERNGSLLNGASKFLAKKSSSSDIVLIWASFIIDGIDNVELSGIIDAIGELAASDKAPFLKDLVLSWIDDIANQAASAREKNDLLRLHTKLGWALARKGDLTGALAALHAGRKFGERLAEQETANADWQHQILTGQTDIGDQLRALGSLTEALNAYQARLAIVERLAALDPGHLQWQRDLSVSHERIGRVLWRQGDTLGALKSFQTAIAAWTTNSHALDQASSLLSQLGRHVEAVANASQRVAALRSADANPTDVASALGNLSWYALLAGQFPEAKAAAQEAFALDGSQLWVLTNAAHAAMFLGESEVCLDIHARYRDVIRDDGRSWADVIRKDYAALREAGLDSPIMAEVERRLTVP